MGRKISASSNISTPEIRCCPWMWHDSCIVLFEGKHLKVIHNSNQESVTENIFTQISKITSQLELVLQQIGTVPFKILLLVSVGVKSYKGHGPKRTESCKLSYARCKNYSSRKFCTCYRFFSWVTAFSVGLANFQLGYPYL